MRSNHIPISGANSNRTSRASTPPSFASSPSSVHSMESFFNTFNTRGAFPPTTVPLNSSSLNHQSQVNNKVNNNHPNIDCFFSSNSVGSFPSPLPSPATSIASTTSSTSSSHFSFSPAHTMTFSNQKGSFAPSNGVQNSAKMVAIGAPQKSSCALFVGDLSFFCTELELAQLFARFGTIDNLEIKRGRHGDSLMHGFVEFVRVEDAERAMQVLDGFKFMGRRMRVYFITHEKVAPRPDSDTWIQVHVNFISLNLSHKVTEIFLETVFSQFGELADIQVKRHLSSPHQISGYAFVYFLNIYDALKAIFTLKNDTNISFEQVYFECCLSYKAEQFLHHTLQHLQQQEQQLQFSCNQNGDHVNNPNSKFVVLQTLANAIKRQQTSNPSAFFKRFEHLNTHANQRNHLNNNHHHNLSDNLASLSSTPGYNRPPLPPSASTPSFPVTSSHMQKPVNYMPNNSNRTSNSILAANYNHHSNGNGFMSLPPHPQAVPSVDSFVPSPSSTRPASHQQAQFLYADQPRNLGALNAADAESSGTGVRYVSSPFAF